MRAITGAAFAGVLLSTSLIGGVANAAEPSTSGEPSSSSSSDAQRREVCAFLEQSDYPHYSDTVRTDINVHGWWEWRSGTSASCKSKYPEAKVTVYLQSSLDGKKWTTRAQGDHTGKTGSGQGKWAYAPFTCKNALLTKWRPLVDVDVLGLVDDPTKVAGVTKELNCGY